MGCVLYEVYTLRSPFAGPGMNYYMLGHRPLGWEGPTCGEREVRINRAEYPPLPDPSHRVAKLCGEILQVEQEAHQRANQNLS